MLALYLQIFVIQYGNQVTIGQDFYDFWTDGAKRNVHILFWHNYQTSWGVFSNLTYDQILLFAIFLTSVLLIVAVSVCFVLLKNKKLREELDEKSRDLREAFEILNKNKKK